MADNLYDDYRSLEENKEIKKEERREEIESTNTRHDENSKISSDTKGS